MDMIADRLGIDPLEFRLQNLLHKGDLYTAGDTPVDCDMKEGLLKVADAIKWSRKADQAQSGKRHQLLHQRCRRHLQSRWGDGQNVIGRQCHAAHRHRRDRTRLRAPRSAKSSPRSFRLPMDQIGVAQLDTDVTPYDISTSASSSMVVMGTAVQRAAQDARKQLLQCAAKVLQQKAEHLKLNNGQVVYGEGPPISFSKVIVDFFGSKAGEIIGKGLYKDKRNAKGGARIDDDFLGSRLGRRRGRSRSGYRRGHLLNYVPPATPAKRSTPSSASGKTRAR